MDPCQLIGVGDTCILSTVLSYPKSLFVTSLFNYPLSLLLPVRMKSAQGIHQEPIDTHIGAPL